MTPPQAKNVQASHQFPDLSTSNSSGVLSAPRLKSTSALSPQAQATILFHLDYSNSAHAGPPVSRALTPRKESPFCTPQPKPSFICRSESDLPLSSQWLPLLEQNPNAFLLSAGLARPHRTSSLLHLLTLCWAHRAPVTTSSLFLKWVSGPWRSLFLLLRRVHGCLLFPLDAAGKAPSPQSCSSLTSPPSTLVSP